MKKKNIVITSALFSLALVTFLIDIKHYFYFYHRIINGSEFSDQKLNSGFYIYKKDAEKGEYTVFHRDSDIALFVDTKMAKMNFLGFTEKNLISKIYENTNCKAYRDNVNTDMMYIEYGQPVNVMVNVDSKISDKELNMFCTMLN